MSVEQGVFALAGAVCVVGSVIAVAHRDPRVAGATLTFVAASAGFHELDGQVAALVVIGVAVAQGIVGYSLVATVDRAE